MSGLERLYNTQYLCGAFSAVCDQVVGANQTTNEMSNQAYEADMALDAAQRSSTAFQNGDVAGGVAEVGQVINTIGGFFR